MSERKRTTDVNDLAFAVIRARMWLHFVITPKGNRQKPRYFVIGHPRCGTTSLHKLFEANGLRSYHDSKDWQTGRFDAFSDFGQVRPVSAYDRVYPNAQFILNFRPLRHYLISIAAHHQKIFSVQNFINEAYRRAEWIDWVLTYFEGRRDFMAVNIEVEGALPAVADYFGLKQSEPDGGGHHNKGQRPRLAANAANIDIALETLGLTEEAEQGQLISSLHQFRQTELERARQSVCVVE
jgi:hypothetical protein